MARIEVRGLTKCFDGVRAVDELSFTVEPGAVTGFLGPNGAGKTTTLRMLLGLVEPDAGQATIGGRPYAALPSPGRTVGAALEASGFHPARTGRDHLRICATVTGASAPRVHETLGLVGLEDAADRRVGGYSLGMRQRLALAAALLGDPEVLVLDEPANGLDPEGISWMRRFLRGLAAEGRAVLVSSHVLSEVQQLVDHVVIINAGRLVHEGPLTGLSGGSRAVFVRTPEPGRLTTALACEGIEPAGIVSGGEGELRVLGSHPAVIGRVAHTERIELQWLAEEPTDLERAYLSLTTTPASRPSQPAEGAW